MVVRVAHSFRRAARNLLDLIQEGNLGLLRAVERFDPELGVRLPTYAAWWVRAYMVKFLLNWWKRLQDFIAWFFHLFEYYPCVACSDNRIHIDEHCYPFCHNCFWECQVKFR